MNATMTPQQYKEASDNACYAVGEVMAVVKFASACNEQVQAYLHSTISPDHKYLLDAFRRHGAQVAG